MAESATPNMISVSCSTEYPDYVYNEKHDIWALVTLTAPCYEEENADDKRAPMDIVAVIDKSGSMSGAKIKLVKKTLEFILTQLKKDDRLCVVTYDTDVSVDFGLMTMTKDNKRKASQIITNIHAGTCTNLSGGLIKGLCQIINRPSKGKNDVASILLFTDGLANEGIVDSHKIIEAMKDPKRYDVRTENEEEFHRENPQAPAPHVSWLKRIFPGGGSAQHQQQQNKPQPRQIPVDNETEKNSFSSAGGSADASVYTFGFGSDHNAEMLKRISDAGNGMYYFIETHDKIGESFAHCLGGLMSTVAQGIQLEIKMAQGVTIQNVNTTRSCEQTHEMCKINMGDLQAEENRDIVLELSLESVHAPYVATPQDLFTAYVNYFNVITNNLESDENSLTVVRPETSSVHDFSTVSAKLTKEKCRVKMTKVLSEAGAKASAGDFVTSKQMLMDEISELKVCSENLGAQQEDLDEDFFGEYNAMMGDLVEYQESVADRTIYESKGQMLQSNLVQGYNCQRSAMPQARNFKSKAKANCVKKSKAFFK